MELRPLAGKGQIWCTKGPKGPICCQIWIAFGIIDSVSAILSHFGAILSHFQQILTYVDSVLSHFEDFGVKMESKWLQMEAHKT